MLQSSPSEVIGLHPLFGHSVDAIGGNTIVICPARTGQWLDLLRNILTKHGVTLIETTPERHDELMAMVQALKHLNSITMGIVLEEWGEDIA
jgi:prephenate dehydrogenase